MEVLTEGSAGYEVARVPQIARFAGVRPAVIARCRDSADVVEALTYARQRGLAIAVRSGGHCFAGRSSTDGLLIDVSAINHVSLDAGVVTVGAGAKLADIYDALEPETTIAGGCGPTVGIAGLALGGGLGILGRRYGLTCDQLTSAEVVLASGEIVRAEEDGDLLWALKGAGGGQFGVVTSLTLKTVPAPPTTCFHVVHPPERAAELIAEWQQWSPDAPRETAASLIVRPDGVHEFGVGEVGADGAVALPYREAKRWLVANGPAEMAEEYASKSLFFRDPLPAEEILDGFTAGELDFSPWAGAYTDVAPDATAFPHRDARFLLKLSGPPEWLLRAHDAARPYSTGGAYINFPDPDLTDWQSAYYGENYPRLQEIKARLDPDDVFSFPQSVAGSARRPR